MKYLLNPITGEVRYTTTLDAKRLARYGWTYTDRAHWAAYQKAKVELAIMRNVKAARPAFGNVH